MKTWEDLKNASDKMAFVYAAISEYKGSEICRNAAIGYEYFKKKNITIMQFQKLLYTMSGEAVPDNYSANHKFRNGFFPIFVKQENSYLLGNGVTFNKSDTKEKLGGDDFDTVLYNAGEYALWGAVAYLYFNYDHVEVFKATEFVPFKGEEDGALHAGIRFWQIAGNKPLRATLYEEDGVTEYIWREGKGEELESKKAYMENYQESIADGVEILDGVNYPSFPIVPLWANKEHQSELEGLREKIDGYDLIQSGYANDLDEASMIYWILQNAGGMDEIDLAKFLDQVRRTHAAVIEDDGAKAEAHTMEVPYQARQAGLADIRDSLYRDAMALDTDKLSASGSITATAIKAAYENLELKCDGFEYCVNEAIKGLLKLAGAEDAPTFHRRATTNQPEVTNMILAAAQYLDDETILKHLPFLNIDEIDEILIRKDKEEADRYAQLEAQLADLQNDGDNTTGTGEEGDDDAGQGKTPNRQKIK